MREITEIYDALAACDGRLAELLEDRMGLVRKLVRTKRQMGLIILQPDERENLKEPWKSLEKEVEYKEEVQEVFASICKAGKRVKAKELVGQNIALIGFMGAGKSAVSHCLKDLLAMDEVETDAMVVEAEGMEITDIFAKHGESYFRECESDAIRRLQKCSQAVISCGGGAVMREENVENLRKCSRIVLLTATPETTLERVRNSKERPILNGHMNVEYIGELMEKRREKYEAAAEITIATDKKTVLEVCEELIEKLNEKAPL